MSVLLKKLMLGLIMTHQIIKILRSVFVIGLIFNFSVVQIFAQIDDLEQMLELEMQDRTDVVKATFKATRIINGHSVENIEKNEFDFRIAHRFGEINTGAYEAFGLDYSSTSIRMDYGLSNNIMVGIGRSTYEKTFDGFMKYTILQQSTGKKTIPVSLSFVTAGYINSLHFTNTERNNYFSSRLSYCHQFLIARKINRQISVQISPTLLHYNLVKTNNDANSKFAVGWTGRYLFAKRTSLNIEYYTLFSDTNWDFDNYNSLSIGVDIETGGHVFQVFATNSLGITENIFISKTSNKWIDGGIHVGFNISRVFTTK